MEGGREGAREGEREEGRKEGRARIFILEGTLQVVNPMLLHPSFGRKRNKQNQ